MKVNSITKINGLCISHTSKGEGVMDLELPDPRLRNEDTPRIPAVFMAAHRSVCVGPSDATSLPPEPTTLVDDEEDHMVRTNE
jgi:hypothetical protein